jgi:hypothetical protein
VVGLGERFGKLSSSVRSIIGGLRFSSSKAFETIGPDISVTSKEEQSPKSESTSPNWLSIPGTARFELHCRRLRNTGSCRNV